jgi:hypothetical protein
VPAGGQIFETTRSTLLKDPDHMLARMFSGRFEVSHPKRIPLFSMATALRCCQAHVFCSPLARAQVTRDEHDAVFIDRDSSVFGLVLNFLRSNELSVSPRCVLHSTGATRTTS